MSRTELFGVAITRGLSEQEAVDLFLACPAEQTFCALFRALTPSIVCYFRARGCEIGVAEDLTQEVMLAVFRQSGALRDKRLFRPWLFKIARNALLQHLRREGRRVPTTELNQRLHDAGGPADDLMVRSHFEEWMAYLEPDERQVLMLRYVEGLEYHEIAAVLDIPLGTAQWRVFHTKRKLAVRFGRRPDRVL